MHDVFISYSHKDARIADAICHKFEEEDIRCWYAPRNIEPGVEWADAIINALESCTVMVLVFTESSNESVQVRREVDTAVSFGKTIIPFKCTDSNPSGSMRYYLSTLHWMDALNAPMEQSVETLLAHVKGLLLPKRKHDPYITQVKETEAPTPNLDSQVEKTSDPGPSAEKIREKEPTVEMTRKPELHAEITKESKPAEEPEISVSTPEPFAKKYGQTEPTEEPRASVSMSDPHDEKTAKAVEELIKTRDVLYHPSKQKNRKPLIISAVVCAAVLIIILASVLGKGKETKNDDVTAGTASSITENTDPKEKIIVGAQLKFPYVYDEGDELHGIEVEIVQDIAEKLGMNLEIVEMDYPEIFSAIEEDKVDIGIGGLSIESLKYKVTGFENVTYTSNYYWQKQEMIVKDDSNISYPEDLNDIWIGCLDYGNELSYSLFDYSDKKNVVYESVEEAMKGLFNGEVDCVVLSERTAKELVAENKGLHTVEGAFFHRSNAFAASKKNTDFRYKLNEVIVEMNKNGTFQAIVDKYQIEKTY